MNANPSIFISNEISISIQSETGLRSEPAHVPPVCRPGVAPEIAISKQMTVAGENLRGSAEDMQFNHCISLRGSDLQQVAVLCLYVTKEFGERYLQRTGNGYKRVEAHFSQSSFEVGEVDLSNTTMLREVDLTPPLRLTKSSDSLS